MNKKAQSGVITAVLLILISLAAVVIVWNVVQGIVEKGVGRTGTDIESMFVQLEVEDRSVNLAGSKLQFSITRGSDNAEIKSLKVSLSGKNAANGPITRTYEIKKEEHGLPGPLETKTYILTNVGDMINKNGVTLLVYAVNEAGKPSAVAAEYKPEQIVGTTITAEGTTISPLNCVSDWEDQLSACVSYKTQTIRKDKNGCLPDEVVSTSENCDCAQCVCPDLTPQIGSCDTNGIKTTTITDPTDCGRGSVAKSYCIDENDPALISMWKFEGNTNDKKGVNNGNLVGGPTYEAGKSGQALKFDGVDDYVSVPHSTSLEPLNELTYTAWIYPLKVDGANYVILQKNDENVATFRYKRFYIGYGILRFGVYNGNTIVYDSGFSITVNTWSHVALTIDEDAFVKMYVNGAQVYSNTNLIGDILITENEPLTIGARLHTDSPSSYFKGTLDEVMIYNKALTANEIKGVYCSQGGSGANCPPL